MSDTSAPGSAALPVGWTQCRVDDLVPQALAFAALGTSMGAFAAWVRSGGDLQVKLADAYGALASGFRE